MKDPLVSLCKLNFLVTKYCQPEGLRGTPLMKTAGSSVVSNASHTPTVNMLPPFKRVCSLEKADTPPSISLVIRHNASHAVCRAMCFPELTGNSWSSGLVSRARDYLLHGRGELRSQTTWVQILALLFISSGTSSKLSNFSSLSFLIYKIVVTTS